jgi:hypothetical protein
MKKLKINSINDLGTFEKVIASKSSEMREIAQELRTLVATVMPGVTEVPWSKQSIASYGVGPKKMSEHFCYIAPQTNHVNFGFYYGTELKDPAKLLEGTGKLLRHVKIRSRTEVFSPALLKLLKQAKTHLPRLKESL